MTGDSSDFLRFGTNHGTYFGTPSVIGSGSHLAILFSLRPVNLRQGFDVVGLDLSDTMLGLARKEIAKFVEYGLNVWGLGKAKSEMDIANESIDRTNFFSVLWGCL